MNELAVQERADLSEFNLENFYGAADNLSGGDLAIRRIHLIQRSSTIPIECDFRPGDIVDLQGKVKIGGLQKDFEFIPVASSKFWLEFDARSEEVLRKVPALSAHEKPEEELVDGISIKRIYYHCFYVLLPNEIEEGIEVPYLISFKRSGLQTAQKLSFELLKMKRQSRPSWCNKFKAHSIEYAGRQHRWFMMDVNLSDSCNEKEINAGRRWAIELNSVIR